MDLQDRVPAEELKRRDERARARLCRRPDDALGLARSRDIPRHVPVVRGRGAVAPSRYHPREPHWYLPLIGVDPARQSEGHGSRLMRRALDAADRDRVAAYLESANPKNVPFYQRLGFELLGTIDSGTSPALFPMLRKPVR